MAQGRGRRAGKAQREGAGLLNVFIRPYRVAEGAERNEKEILSILQKPIIMEIQ